jgi:aspartate 1-decarboxylase
VLDIDNGARFETYTIAGARGTRELKINGAAARLVHTGDKVIVVSYASYSEADLEKYEPVVVHVNAENDIVTVDDAVAELLS